MTATTTSPDYPRKQNKFLKKYDKREGGLTAQEREISSKLKLSWAGNPSYEAMKKDKRKVIRAPRMVSAVSPDYPMGPWLIHGEARVEVSLMIDEAGNVEATKIFTSSDSRFNKNAQAAVKKWKYQPAMTASGPTKTLMIAPLVFKIEPKV